MIDVGSRWKDRFGVAVTVLEVDPPPGLYDSESRYVRIQRPRVRTYVRYDEFFRRYRRDRKWAEHHAKYPDDPNQR